MSDRREFLKSAGLLGLAPWSKGLPAAAHGSDLRSEDEPAADAAVPLEADAIVLENSEMRLVVSSSGAAQSLIHKPSGQECLEKDAGVPMFTVTQYRPYDNELQLAYPAKLSHFPAEHVRREGDSLIVRFALVGYEAAIGIKITDAYIAFRLQSLTYKGYTQLGPKVKTPIDETLFVQLPVRKRKNLGEWLNVMWDDEVAVNVLATDPFAQIDADARDGYSLFRAGTVQEVQLEGVGAALITTKTAHLLDRIARVEEDFNLPRGVESRRCKEYKFSYFEILAMTPQDVDQHIKFAKMSGFRTMNVYYMAFAKIAGHFPWLPEYPNGMQDLIDVVAKIKAAGIIPGLHIHYNKAHIEDAYVTPKPDPRLNLRYSFNLAADIDARTTVIQIEEDPRLCTMDDGRRILRIQNELITYERYSSAQPFQFENCQRGALGTHASSHEIGSRVGLLDMDVWPLFVRFTQNTTIQAEVAERLAEIYQRAGFKFVYFDGAQSVPPPYWYTVSRAQWIVNERFQPRPLFAEGACKSHFSWHILTRGNAFDVFKPEMMKAATRAYAGAEAPRAAKDFTSVNFGWIKYRAPSSETIGTQPDMLEYVTSRAAGWDCPIALMSDLAAMDAHPRTPDNLEVIRRWEDVRARMGLTQEQKMSLRNLNQEHMLLIDEKGDFELASCFQIENVAGKDAPGRAFIFERDGNVWVAFWHTSGEGTLELPWGVKKTNLMRELGKPLPVKENGKELQLPMGERRFLEFYNATRQEVIFAFQSAKIVTA